MRTARSFAVSAAVVLLSTLAAVAVAEFAIRHWLHAVPQLELDLYRRDPHGNLLLRPGIERRHVTRLWDATIHINSEGWRDREPGPAETAPAILGLGDSMAFGWGVPLEESLLSLLEQRIGREHPARLIKAGVPGTGTGDQLRLLELIWPRYQPRAVLLCFFVGNDFVDVQSGGAAQYEVTDGLLAHRPLGNESGSWLAAARSQLVRRSHLLQLVRAVQLNWTRPDSLQQASRDHSPRRWDDWLREFAQVHLKNYPERTRRAVEETLRYLDGFQAFCQSQAAPLVLVVIPRSFQVYPREREEWLAGLGLSEGDLDLDRPQRLLNGWATERSVVAVDLLAAFRAHQRDNPGVNLYYYPDAHLNALGHRVAAEAIYSDDEAMRVIRSALGATAQTTGDAVSSRPATPLQ
jgi:lysophospholipase L1-like esterase